MFDKAYRDAKAIFKEHGQVELIFRYADGGVEHKLFDNINNLRCVLKFMLNMYKDEVTVDSIKFEKRY
jgi:hypothetical protein